MAKKKYPVTKENLQAPATSQSKYTADKFKVRIYDSCIATDENKNTYDITSVFGYDEDGNSHIYSSGIFTEGYQMMAELKKDGTVEVSEIVKDERD